MSKPIKGAFERRDELNLRCPVCKSPPTRLTSERGMYQSVYGDWNHYVNFECGNAEVINGDGNKEDRKQCRNAYDIALKRVSK